MRPHIHTYTYTHTHIHTHAHSPTTYTYIHPHIHTYIHTYIHIQSERERYTHMNAKAVLDRRQALLIRRRVRCGSGERRQRIAKDDDLH